MQKTNAIIFDLGGVILNIDYQLTRKAFEDIGITNFNDMYSQADADELFRKLETGQISETNFYDEINHRTSLNLPSTVIEKAWNKMLLTFREKSLQFLETLRPRYKLFLLSNTNHIHLKEFIKIYNAAERKKPFEKYFDKVYYSCEIGLRKPNLDIYEYVLNENGLEPKTTLFVDDSVQNVESAVMAGMQGLVLLPGKFIEELDL
jgi:putative hydrolase of the HAD superfamily